MNYWLERITNRVTMEKLVLYCLFAIFAVALILSAVGQLPFNPLELLISFAVLVFVSYGVNTLLGYLFGVGVSHESPVITALILGFIITPTVQPLGLTILALTASIAMASKFVLVVRGRHVFNPAAIAVVLVGLTGLQYATWWVATPPLLPIVAIGAFLVLYKTRHLLMGAVFLLVAIPIIVVSGLIDGSSVSYALSAVFVSWPLIFFVGYMLSEPLTLPPRRWQKLSLAAITGIGVALPFHIGIIATSPEIILVLINIVAFAAGQKRGVRLKLAEIRQLTPTTKELRFTSQIPVQFRAGQYLELNLPHEKPDLRGTRRSFSIVGSPGESSIALGIKFPEKPSSYKRALSSLATGATVTATRVSGDFILPKNLDTPLLFIAGGVGITPFVSHLALFKGNASGITLVYAVGHTDELAYLAAFVDAGVRVIVVTPHIATKVQGVQYIDAPYISKEVLAKSVPTLSGSFAYVSGPPLMVDATVGALKSLGVRRIKRDHFSGY